MPITLSEAIEEAWASAPDRDIILHCLEVNHSEFTEPARVVNWPILDNEPREFFLRHESTAPLNPNQVVLYLGLPFHVVLPESSLNTTGNFQIRVEVGEDLDHHLEAAAKSQEVIKATYRQYILGRETEGPASFWMDLTVTSPRREGQTIIFDGAVITWGGKPYGDIYLPTTYPALVNRGM